MLLLYRLCVPGSNYFKPAFDSGACSSAIVCAVSSQAKCILNGTCSVLLLISLYFIKNGKIAVHKRINILAFCLSSLFLVSYILFHYLAPETRFGDLNGDGRLSDAEKASAGSLRYLYYVILTSHIILAAGVLPLILLSFYRGLQMQVEQHKKLVRWAFPIWLYVTITGVIVYLMMAPYYHF